jgi:pentatricopeptide repeat protein
LEDSQISFVCQHHKEADRAFSLLYQMQSHPEQFRDSPDEVLYNCLLDMCVRFRDLNAALFLFKQMKTGGNSWRRPVSTPASQAKPSAVTYGILIKAYGAANMLDESFEMFKDMLHSKLVPNAVTYGCLLDACVKNNRLEKAKEVWENMKNHSLKLNTILYTTMIKAYSKAFQLEQAIELYNQMMHEKSSNPEVTPNNVTYNSLLDCCVRCFNMPQAKIIFEAMCKSKDP